MPDGDFTPVTPPMKFKLADLKTNETDPRGRVVRDILWAVNEFKIYRTDLGVSPFFSDEPELAAKQKDAYLSLGSGIAEFSHLIEILRPTSIPFTNVPVPRGPSVISMRVQYERELARCIAQALLGHQQEAHASLECLRDRLAAQIRNRARVVHLLINVFLVILAVTGAMSFVLLDYQSQFGFNTKEFGLAVMMGSVGALFSTTVRLQWMEIDATITQFMHWVYGAQRVLIGAMGALVIYFGFRSGVLNGLLEPIAGTIDTEAPYNPYWLSFVCVLAGFSERLVPNLLDSHAESVRAASETAPG